MSLSRLRVLRRHDEAIEAIADDGDGPRVTAWPGEAPDRPPRHPSLARPLEHHAPLALEGPWWLELRPPGASLGELGELSEADLASLLLDLAEALAALHAAGRAHGRVDAAHVVVNPGGRAVLIGACRGEGSPAADARALRMLMASLWPAEAKAPPPDPGEEPAEVIAESLAGWLEVEAPGHSAFHLGTRSLALAPSLPEEAEHLDATGPVDEVGVDLGPEGRGLFDPWTTGPGSGTRTRDLAGDTREEAAGTSLLARLMSPFEVPADPARLEGQEEAAGRALRRVLAEEALDALLLPLPASAEAPAPEVEEAAPPGLEDDVPPEAPAETRRWLGALALAALFAALLAALLRGGA